MPPGPRRNIGIAGIRIIALTMAYSSPYRFERSTRRVVLLHNAGHGKRVAMKSNMSKNKLLSLFLTAVIVAAGTVVPTTRSSADVIDEVMAEFTQLEKSGSAVGTDWFGLARKARSAGELVVAGQALDRAEALQVSPISVRLERARLKVSANDPAAAVAEIQAVMDAGFTSVRFLTQDAELNSLAGRPDYDSLIETMSVQAFPCRHQPGFSDFDFWIGEWDVAVASGVAAGTNSIQPAEKGCVLIEQWRNTAGGTGMSINYLDKATDEWVQVWNAEGGSQINIRGGMTDEGMRMEGTLHTVGAGTTVPFRALWTPLPDGRVRQFFEQSNDGGETWVPWFEGFYTRRD